MPGMDELNRRIEALENAIAECKEVTREAHSATKQLRLVLKETQDMIKNDVRNTVTDQLAEEVSRGLESYTATLLEAQTNAVRHIEAEFNSLAQIYLTGPKGNENLHDIAMKRKWGRT